jgi:hypothetical protein
MTSHHPRRAACFAPVASLAIWLVSVPMGGCAGTHPVHPEVSPAAPAGSSAPASTSAPATAAGGAAGAPVLAGEAALPPLLRGIDLTPAQVDQVVRIDADVQRSVEPFVSAVSDYERSVAGAVRKCKGETPFVESDAARVVRVGEELRVPALDAVQKVHRLLTPAQRRKVSGRLIEGDDAAKREKRNSARTRDLGPTLDLSTTQTMSMLLKAAVLWTWFADRVEPWRVKYHAAITHFADDDFDVHAEPVAAVPVVELTLEFVRAGLRALIPILQPKQCDALGQLIDQKVDEQAARVAEQDAARARALERR